MVPVVVAAVEILRGGSLTADMVKIQDFPKDLVPQGAINKVEDVVDRAVFTPMMKDELVLEGKLAPKGSGRGLAALVLQGDARLHDPDDKYRDRRGRLHPARQQGRRPIDRG